MGGIVAKAGSDAWRTYTRKEQEVVNCWNDIKLNIKDRECVMDRLNALHGLMNSRVSKVASDLHRAVGGAMDPTAANILVSNLSIHLSTCFFFFVRNACVN